ncbi:mucoidy inhibitor MuiA family protein [Flavihumibacter rivuli]|uniref:mucoidy inhibitor MuiA family protein n=1 Tax=Flavihumibacter rivuli TaxID=2838156 RepID=UPI001BDE3D22|nr:mucoidy inhibitor MuiA family protein [Flavihumibacter rivuli]ULQ56520.1 mucoidy inhibitor MuiA family protein [Flavihumibacter rivuli]
MDKRIAFHLILVVLGYALPVVAQNKKVNAETQVQSVTVYLSGAQVFRSGSVTVPAGRSEIILDGISSDIEQQSIQVEMEGDLTILAVGMRKNFLDEKTLREEVKQLEVKRDGIQEQIDRQNKMLEIYKQEENMLVKNQAIAGTSVVLKPAELKASLDFQRTRLEEVLAKQLEIQKMVKDLAKEKDKIVLQLQELNQRKNEAINEVYALTEAARPVQTKLTASYVVKKAGWYPTYTVRVKDIGSPLELQFNANVYQSSGEKWKEVKVALSSGNPNTNNEKPSIEPWYLRFIDPSVRYSPMPAFGGNAALMGRVVDDKGAPIANASVIIKGSSSGVVSDADGIFRLSNVVPGTELVVSSLGYESRSITAVKGFLTVPLDLSSSALQEVVVMGYAAGSVASDEPQRNVSTTTMKSKPVTVTTVYQPTTTRFDISQPYTIEADGKVNIIEVKRVTMAAQYEYYAAPKLDEAAYLTAKVVNWQEFDLLAGEAGLIYEGSFLGKSYLDPASQGDTLKLSLGKDDGVIVKRKLINEYREKKMIGSNKKDTRAYELLVRNNKPVPISLVLQDQLPIATSKDIEVDDTEYKGGKLDEETRVVTWNINLAQRQEQKYTIKFSVKYPRDKTLQLD